MRPAHYERTDTSCLGVVESESGVARQTIRSGVHRTADAGLCDAVVACAYIHYETTTSKLHDANVNFQMKSTHMHVHTDAHARTQIHI